MRYHHRPTVVKQAGTPDEGRLTVVGEVQPRKGFFPISTDVDIGDIVEVPDPRPDRDVIRYRVGDVRVYQGYGHGDHIEVTWGPPERAARPASEGLALGRLHREVVQAAGALYEDGHFAQAVFEAFKAVEVRVRSISELDEVGAKLMGRALGGEPPLMLISNREGRMGRDEQAGRMHILMGSMEAVRNLGAHELEGMEQASAIELLGMASQCMRWLDDSTFLLS